MYEIKEEVKKQSEFILEKICLINSYLDVLEILNKNVEEKNEVLFKFPAFFNISSQAIYTSIIIEVGKLLDNREDSVSINSLIILFKNNKELLFNNKFICSVEENIEDLQKSAELIKNIKNQRHKIFAHHDKRVVYGIKKFQAKNPIEFEDIRNILSTIGGISNTLLSNVGGVQCFFSYENSDDIKKLLYFAKIGIDMKSEYFEKRYKNKM